MLISKNWLKKYINLADSVTPAELALKLSLSTVEVEGYSQKASELEGVMVGKIEKIEPHPDADKLRVCTVAVGKERVVIVCGGSNIKEGMLTAVALPGSRVRWHGEGELVELAPTTIRGVASHGMICASDEIGLKELFPKKEDREIVDLTSLRPHVGTPIAQALGLDDVVFEIDNKSLSHRPDLWGHYGMARELAVLYKRTVSPYKISSPKPGKERVLKVEVEAKKECVRYQGVIISGIKEAESPLWLKNALNTVGIQSINCIVDITNYVMLDLGQPLHAFDAQPLLSDKQVTIKVRTAHAGEKIVMLDGKERKLEEGMLVIADEEKPWAVAGVMGGKASGVSSDTSTIVLESACFEASSIRQTSTKLNVRTDASARFEKSLDPNLTQTALAKAIELITSLCPGAYVASNIVDYYPAPVKLGSIIVPATIFTQKLGVTFSPKLATTILERLGFEIKSKKDSLIITVPTWRSNKDIKLPEDIVEEVVRVYGYDQIPSVLPLTPLDPPSINKAQVWQRRLQDLAVYENSFFEVYNYSFVSSFQIRRLGDDIAHYLELDNPLSKEKPFLRRNLLVNLLDNLEKAGPEYPKLGLFEIGKIFLAEEPGMKVKAQSDELLPRQDTWFTAVYMERKNNAPFWELKRFLERFTTLYGLPCSLRELSTYPSWQHPYRSFAIDVGDIWIGNLYEVHPVCSSKWGIEQRVAALELNISTLEEKVVSESSVFVPPPVYPEVVRDLAFWVATNVAHKAISEAFHTIDPLVKKVQLFDIFYDKKKPNEKSVAYRITYSNPHKTLTTDEVNVLTERITQVLKEQFKATLRT